MPVPPSKRQPVKPAPKALGRPVEALAAGNRCLACGGAGKGSKGYQCAPCKGTGIAEKGDRHIL